MPLSDAMAKHPGGLRPALRGHGAAGEAGGALDQTLIRLATQLEKDDSLRRSIKSAMTYPVLIAVFAIMVMIGMLLFIIPIFANMYNDLGGQLPSLTRLMMGVSNVLKGYWFIIFPVDRRCSSGLWCASRTPSRAAGAWDRIKLKLPMKLGPIIQKIAVARFSRTLATLVELRRAHPAGHRDHRQDLGQHGHRRSHGGRQGERPERRVHRQAADARARSSRRWSRT